jgi:hypothetical protein
VKVTVEFDDSAEDSVVVISKLRGSRSVHTGRANKHIDKVGQNDKGKGDVCDDDGEGSENKDIEKTGSEEDEAGEGSDGVGQAEPADEVGPADEVFMVGKYAGKKFSEPPTSFAIWVGPHLNNYKEWKQPQMLRYLAFAKRAQARGVK